MLLMLLAAIVVEHDVSVFPASGLAPTFAASPFQPGAPRTLIANGKTHATVQPLAAIQPPLNVALLQFPISERPTVNNA